MACILLYLYAPPLHILSYLYHYYTSIFDVPDNARKLINSIDEHFDQAAAVTSKPGPDVPPIKVFWLDMWDDATPFVGACCGSIQTILEKAGAKHILDDQAIEEVRTWDAVSWDVIIPRDPDLIVIMHAWWAPAGKSYSIYATCIQNFQKFVSHHQHARLIFLDEKIFKLCSNEDTRKLRAVQNRAFLVVPFTASTPSVRIGALAYNLAEAMAAIIRGEALPSIQFSETSIGSADWGAQAVGRSGVVAFEKLPTCE